MKRPAIYARDDHTCQYCGNGASSLDHLVPKAAGGVDGWHNLVSACGTCNRLKGERHLPDLAESMRELIARGRTCDRHYPPLFWQVQRLELPHEALETNPQQSRWFDRTLLKLVFSEPGGRRLRRRGRLGAVRALASAVPGLGVQGAAWELERLCLTGEILVCADSSFESAVGS